MAYRINQYAILFHKKIKKKRQGSGAFEKAKVSTAFGTAEQE